MRKYQIHLLFTFLMGCGRGWGRLEAWKGYSSKLSINDKGCGNITVEEP